MSPIRPAEITRRNGDQGILPGLRRILLDDEWEGHPLLKSYAVDTPYPPYR